MTSRGCQIWMNILQPVINTNTNNLHRRHTIANYSTTNSSRPTHITTSNANSIPHQITSQEPLERQGMPAALFNNASPPAMLMDKSREMEAAAAKRREIAICPTDDDTVAPKSKKTHHKQSLDYIWRTGLAGGLAGSAVCTLKIQEMKCRQLSGIGKNSCRPSRSC